MPQRTSFQPIRECNMLVGSSCSLPHHPPLMLQLSTPSCPHPCRRLPSTFTRTNYLRKWTAGIPLRIRVHGTRDTFQCIVTHIFTTSATTLTIHFASQVDHLRIDTQYLRRSRRTGGRCECIYVRGHINVLKSMYPGANFGVTLMDQGCVDL